MLTVKDLESSLNDNWRKVIGYEFARSYWKNIVKHLNDNPRFLPSRSDIFAAFDKVKPEKVKVVIVGQDPFSRHEQATGFAFSSKVSNDIVKNIYNELKSEYGYNKTPRRWSLEPLSTEGVLLLNIILTVGEGEQGSHKEIGWREFTSSVIRYLDKNNDCVFIAIGSTPTWVCKNNVENNDVIYTGHPSPINTSIPFLGCGCFRECNQLLVNKNILPVRWSVLFKK